MHEVSIVIPVYRGADVLATTVAEILSHDRGPTPQGVEFRVSEVILVNDCGPDGSAEVMRNLAAAHPVVRCIWLMRNYGQHAATIAGMAASRSGWVATMDEDGQQDPADLGALLDTAIAQRADVVYASPRNGAPHGFLRNIASRAAKRIINVLAADRRATIYNSHRLIRGDVARAVAGYAGPGVYLDVALGWVAGRYATVSTVRRDEGRPSGYRLRTLFGHFLRLVVSSGTRPLRIVTTLGLLVATAGVVLSVWIGISKIAFGINVEGWSSLAVISLLGFGALMFSLGIVAEYVGASLTMAMGKPLYSIRPEDDGA